MTNLKSGKMENQISKVIYSIRDSIKTEDPENIREIVSSTGFFNNEEVEIAVELADERLSKGIESGYHFLILEIDGKTVGYSCFGPIPATKFSFDLYWIAVHKDYQNLGLGKIILTESENAISKLGGNRIYVETSGREQYISTRKFYLACDYKEEAVLEDFYAPGDAKYLYLKVLV
ncbi:MAG: GNAT family N-acetyltransferase [Ignavibacteriales bacterium]|nr:GNAT family N-acetyltransferase [Ignavibacteriales bacterium]